MPAARAALGLGRFVEVLQRVAGVGFAVAVAELEAQLEYRRELRARPHICARPVDILNTEALSEALGCASDRARRMLELRYGLGGECPCTLAEVGRTFNVTRERIRQIENESLRKLKDLPSAQQLRDAI